MLETYQIEKIDIHYRKNQGVLSDDLMMLRVKHNGGRYWADGKY